MAAEPETYQPEVLAEEEPRYLRRQKPVEIRRRKFGKRAWLHYFRVALSVLGVAAGIALCAAAVRFLLYSPRFALQDPDQVELSGNCYVSRAAVLEKFYGDRGRSVLRIPVGERRAALEAIPWVERASVQRILPNRIRVELVERVPVAFLRLGTELALIDAHGVILERPVQGEFNFAVVTGISEGMPLAERERRMKLYVQFVNDIEMAKAGASAHVSEVDLADASDLRATLAGMPELAEGENAQGAVLVHFGDKEFLSRFQIFLQNVGQWRATVGRVESVDLRFDRQVVVNPETQPGPATPAPAVAKANRPGQ
jgi:cell division protein FtsQ